MITDLLVFEKLTGFFTHFRLLSVVENRNYNISFIKNTSSKTNHLKAIRKKLPTEASVCWLCGGVVVYGWYCDEMLVFIFQLPDKISLKFFPSNLCKPLSVPTQ